MGRVLNGEAGQAREEQAYYKHILWGEVTESSTGRHVCLSGKKALSINWNCQGIKPKDPPRPGDSAAPNDRLNCVVAGSENVADPEADCLGLSLHISVF